MACRLRGGTMRDGLAALMCTSGFATDLTSNVHPLRIPQRYGKGRDQDEKCERQGKRHVRLFTYERAGSLRHATENLDESM
jgi:hypothetical protein